MSDRSSFSRVSRTPLPLYGPRKLLVCGFTPEGLARLDKVITAADFPDLPVVYAGSTDLEEPLRSLLSRPHRTGREAPSRMPPAIIMAGITQGELHQLISIYRSAGMPAPLWATLTPTSENWTLRQLLTELSAEKAALEKKPPAGGTKE